MMKKKKIEINPETILRRDPEQEFTYIDGEVVMLSLKNGEYYGLDYVGTYIWELIEEEIKFSDLKKYLLKQFEIEENECVSDTIDFLKKLCKKDLITIKE